MALGELPPQYRPQEIEIRRYQEWVGAGFFRADPASDALRFVVAMPPPNVTGSLHIGHALNNSVQDIVVRWKRMAGYEALWIPGIDHAGIATQNVVEKQLARESLTRFDLGRRAFLERVWAWKEEYGDRIAQQFKRMGLSCDWSRERFTMDERYSRAVLEVFIRLHEEGLIYRGEYLVNWCVRCGTALSDDEVEHREVQGKLYYVRYPVKGQDGHVTVATTRPETMLGDTAVARHPDDERHLGLEGKTAVLPILGRELPIVADRYVAPEFGTGLVKVTPAHDPNDFRVGEAHGLPRVNILNPDGTLNEEAGPYAGQDRLAAREGVVARLAAEGLLERVEDHPHAVGHCYRCGTMIEPYLSIEWLVRMAPLAEPALLAAQEGKLRFIPERWTKVYTYWLENIRDWCISRKLWWGHRIPAWYCLDCDEGKWQEVGVEGGAGRDRGDGPRYQFLAEARPIVARIPPEACPDCGSDRLVQDEDVLDTWFSSWLWPFVTLGWPEETEDLETFYPTHLLSTAQEIIFLWVARMVMAGLHFTGRLPFREVYIHGTVKTEEGQRMAKSLGTGVDPVEVIDQVGADALRYTLVSITGVGSDLYLSMDKFELGRNFANKLWNASRFVLRNFPADFSPLEMDPHSLDLILSDRWVLSRLQATIRAVTGALEAYRLHDATGAIYDFLWHEYCDWYLELSKPRLGREGEAVPLYVLWGVLETALRLLHPVMPFITEEIWQLLPHRGETVVRAPWPEPDPTLDDPEAEVEMALVQAFVGAIRNIRGELNVPAGRKAKAIVRLEDGREREVLEAHRSDIVRLARLETIEVDPRAVRPRSAATAVVQGIEVYLPLEGLIDIKAERGRLLKERDRLRGLIEQCERQLANEDFLNKAPEHVVDRERSQREELLQTLEKVERNLASLEAE